MAVLPSAGRPRISCRTQGWTGNFEHWRLSLPARRVPDLFTNCAQLPQCPWHAPQDTNEDRLPLSFSHFICTKDPSTSIVEFVGQLKEGPTDGIIQVFHVCTNEQLRDMSLYRHVTPSKVSLFHSSLSEANTTEDQFQQLVQPFQHVELPQETYRHLFVRAGGPASSLDVWLRERSRE